MKSRPVRRLSLVLLLLLAAQTDLAASERVVFSDPLDGSGKATWRCAPTNFVELPGSGRALHIVNGTEWNRSGLPWAGDKSWTTYRVEVDIRPEKMWAEIDFHVQDNGRAANCVTLFQNAKGELFFETGELQGRAGAWKLWPVGQRQGYSPTGQWVRVKLDVGISTANLYLNNEAQPVATFYDLPFAKGGVRLTTYAGSAWFRNLRVSALPKNAVKPILKDDWAEARHGKVLRDWKITPREDPGYGKNVLPEPLVKGEVSWRKAPVDARGVVDLTGLFGSKNTSGVVFARTTLKARAAGTRTLKLTYTDNFTLWCNREKVFDGPPRQWFRPDRQKYGNSRLIPDQFTVKVPVRAGKNVLLVRSEITEPFGWGFWMRVAE